jgi:hypothetical protein
VDIMNRARLPNRRPNQTIDLHHKGMTFNVTVGFDAMTGAPMEVFGNASKAGSDFAALLADACVILSLALQHGIQPSALSKTMQWTPVMGQADKVSEPASVIGAILVALVPMEVARVSPGDAK